MSDEAKKVDVWMPLWIGAYLADTMKLTTIQHGAYLLLLIAYWRERKPLADIDDELRSITKLERAEWKRNRPVLAQFFRVGDGIWWHKRVEAEIQAAEARAKKSSEKASKAAQARWGDKGKQPSSNAPSMPQALPEDMHEECPTPSPTPLPSGDSEANASGGEPPAKTVRVKTAEEAAASKLWRDAKLAFVESGSAKDFKQAGELLGAMASKFGKLIFVDALTETLKATPVDPHTYLVGLCEKAAGRRPGLNRQEAIEERNRAVGDEWLRQQEAADASN